MADGSTADAPDPRVVGRAGSSDAGFLGVPEPTPDVRRSYDDDLDDPGYVMNLTRLWAHLPGAQEQLSGLLTRAVEAASLTMRQRGILICACASTLGDAYCSLAWGKKLAGEAGDDVAAGVLRGDDRLLDPAEQALARWARRVTRAPNATDATDVRALLDAGYDKRQVLAITIYVALRLAFSTVNDALGARPDAALGRTVPAQVREAVTFGRPVALDEE